MKKTILETPIPAFCRDLELDSPYRAVIESNGSGLGVLSIEQKIKDKWHGTGGRWLLSSLLKGRPDLLYIDLGQGWGVKGLIDVYAEAVEVIAATKPAYMREYIDMTITKMTEYGTDDTEINKMEEFMRVLEPCLTIDKNNMIETTHGKKSALGLFRTARDLTNHQGL